MIKQKIIELCSEDLSDAQFIKEVEKCLKEMHPYNHSLRSAQDACGINIGGVSIEIAGKASEIIERIETKYTKPDGSTHINLKTVVYQKGLDYIRKLLEVENEHPTK